MPITKLKEGLATYLQTTQVGRERCQTRVLSKQRCHMLKDPLEILEKYL